MSFTMIQLKMSLVTADDFQFVTVKGKKSHNNFEYSGKILKQTAGNEPVLYSPYLFTDKAISSDL